MGLASRAIQSRTVKRSSSATPVVPANGRRRCARSAASRCVWVEWLARSAGKHAEAFKGGGDTGAKQAVVAAVALGEHFDELHRAKAFQVHACGRGRDAGDGGELGRGTGATVHQARKHAGA